MPFLPPPPLPLHRPRRTSPLPCRARTAPLAARRLSLLRHRSLSLPLSSAPLSTAARRLSLPRPYTAARRRPPICSSTRRRPCLPRANRVATPPLLPLFQQQGALEALLLPAATTNAVISFLQLRRTNLLNLVPGQPSLQLYSLYIRRRDLKGIFCGECLKNLRDVTRKSEAKQVFCFRHQTSTLLNLLKQSKQEKLLPCRLIHSMDLLAMRDIPRFAVVDGLPHGLLDSLLPGPVTVILKKGDSSILEKSLNPGLDSIGVRVPDYDFICAIARGFGSALALTSANLSGQLSSVSPKDFEHLWRHCSHIFDGGLLQGSRAGSTVVDLTKAGTYKILRTGSAREETVAVLRSFFLKEVL